MSDSITPLGAYLRARRDALRPEDAGIAVDPRRRVRGLRRQEVAGLAGISADYYLRLEQGRDHQPSPQVLRALGRALQLDADATNYLFRLAGQTLSARSAEQCTPGTNSGPAQLLANMVTLLNQWTMAPAYVVDRNQDVLAVNPLGRAFIPLSLAPGANMVEAIVEGASGAVKDRKPYWDRAIHEAVAALRYHSDPDDQRLQLLVASLSSHSRVFRDAWASHEAHPQRSGVTPVSIDPFGYIPFRWQTLEVPNGGQFLTTFFGDPGSAAAAAIDYLRAKLRVDHAIDGAGPDESSPDAVADVQTLPPSWSSEGHAAFHGAGIAVVADRSSTVSSPNQGATGPRQG